jgi:hypothetical protein
MLDKTPCRGVYRICCNADSCNSEMIIISPNCIGCSSSLVEILDLDDKVLNTIPTTAKEEEKKRVKPKILQVTEATA